MVDADLALAKTSIEKAPLQLEMIVELEYRRLETALVEACRRLIGQTRFMQHLALQIYESLRHSACDR